MSRELLALLIETVSCCIETGKPMLNPSIVVYLVLGTENCNRNVIKLLHAACIKWAAFR